MTQSVLLKFTPNELNLIRQRYEKYMDAVAIIMECHGIPGPAEVDLEHGVLLQSVQKRNVPHPMPPMPNGGAAQMVLDNESEG